MRNHTLLAATFLSLLVAFAPVRGDEPKAEPKKNDPKKWEKDIAAFEDAARGGMAHDAAVPSLGENRRGSGTDVPG